MDSISSGKGIRGCVESLIGGRSENQDSYGIAETRLGLLVVVCDGMGGGPSGKTASSLATQAILDYVSGADPDREPEAVMSLAVTAANEAVIQATVERPELKGMGTTCVCLLIAGHKAYVAHVGDSRLYQLRGTNVVFRTADHSYVAEMVRRGTITEEEARNSRYSNVITRAIGAEMKVDPETDVVDIRPGDRFALMTDGIWGTLSQTQLVKFLSADEDPATLVPRIAGNIDTLGRDNGGGHDNLTLAIVDIPAGKEGKEESHREGSADRPAAEAVTAPRRPDRDGGEEAAREEKEERRRPTLLYTIILVVFVLGVIVGVTALMWNRNDPKDSVVEKVEQVGGNVAAREKAAPAVATQEFGEAVSMLEALRTFDPGKMTYDQVRKEKMRIHGQIVDKLKKGVEKTTEAGAKEKARAAAEGIEKDRRFIIQIDKNRKTTAEAIKYIDQYREALSGLTK